MFIKIIYIVKSYMTHYIILCYYALRRRLYDGNDYALPISWEWTLLLQLSAKFEERENNREPAVISVLQKPPFGFDGAVYDERRSYKRVDCVGVVFTDEGNINGTLFLVEVVVLVAVLLIAVCVDVVNYGKHVDLRDIIEEVRLLLWSSVLVEKLIDKSGVD